VHFFTLVELLFALVLHKFKDALALFISLLLLHLDELLDTSQEALFLAGTRIRAVFINFSFQRGLTFHCDRLAIEVLTANSCIILEHLENLELLFSIFLR